MMSVLAKLHQLLLKAETLLLVMILISLILIAVAQILMRNFLGGGLLWADAYTRISVLWIAMIGAMIASRQHGHIAIDILIQRLPGRWKTLGQRISDGLTALICFAGAWFGGDFVMREYAYGDKAFAEIPNWWCEAIIPFAFVVIALRYGAAALMAEPSNPNR
ncbi:TRAP transporter small permease [Methylomonas sp. LL1]|uniref:TRAP transporter small permease n=1 Tax=Methylomonas sp. LL1 TaxID=2785785 RepID=UPI0018C43E24|nr:TRAP transporter small permease [Methylomonas sp. LL1]QPK61999.1 TRAP transporter small permease [Methylomonas sp. LL1]